VTFRALFPKPPLVYVVPLVTAVTCARRLPIDDTSIVARLVAGRTSDRRVAAAQRKISRLMVKGRTVEPYDIEIPSFMVGMAFAALATMYIAETPVESGLAGDILGNLFMTVQTQVGLGLFTEPGVTFGTLRFILRVPFDHLAGHQQRFYLGRARWPRPSDRYRAAEHQPPSS